jgi:hypothetical protein
MESTVTGIKAVTIASVIVSTTMLGISLSVLCFLRTDTEDLFAEFMAGMDEFNVA